MKALFISIYGASDLHGVSAILQTAHGYCSWGNDANWIIITADNPNVWHKRVEKCAGEWGQYLIVEISFPGCQGRLPTKTWDWIKKEAAKLCPSLKPARSPLALTLKGEPFKPKKMEPASDITPEPSMEIAPEPSMPYGLLSPQERKELR